MLFVDKASTLAGHVFSWAILGLTFLISWEVFSRYALNTPHAWVLDAQIMLYGIMFMMAGAYTLSRNGHVRGDVLYRLLPLRVQAAIELVLYLIFFFPGFGALLVYGLPYALTSWNIQEVSIYSPTGTPLYPLKALIPIGAAFMLLQGIAESIRCIICLREGAWPQRLHDVEEMESAILAEQQDRARIEAELHVGGAGR